MKLLHRDGKLIGTATDDYIGSEAHIDAPHGFDITRMADYVVTNNVAAIPVAPMVQQIMEAMTALFDSTAQSRRYDDRITCALRAGYAGPFQAEGGAFAVWMDSCNAFGYTMLSEVQAGTRPMPATVAEGLALLPPMVWPV